MAITENSFTGEEIGAALTANPDLLTIVRGTLAERKFTVQDETEHQAFLTNHESVVAQKITKTHAEQLEKDVLEMTGIPKADANEKYYDYFKRATTEKLGSVTKLQGELDELKKGHNPSAADKARITELETAIETTKKELGEKLTAKEQEVQNIKKGSVVHNAMSGIRSKYKAGLDADMVKIVEDSVLASVMKDTSIQDDGTVTVLKEDGTVELNKSTFKPLTVEEKLTEKLKSLIDAGKKQDGSGTKKDDIKSDGSKKEFTGVPANVDSRIKLDVYLQELGYLPDTEDYIKIFDEHSKGLKLR